MSAWRRTVGLRVAPLLIAALVCGAALAQQKPGTVATLTSLEGNVLVSEGDAMASAVNNQRVPAGARLLTTAGSTVTVVYDDGCRITLEENSRFTVRLGAVCAVLAGEVVPLSPAGAPAVVGTAPNVNTAIGIGVAAAVGAGGYYATRNDKNNVSPN